MALTLMAMGGLASAASASPPDDIYCATNGPGDGFGCLNAPYTTTGTAYGNWNLGTWAETRYGGSLDNAGHNCTRYVAFRLADNGLGDTGTWGDGGNWPNHFAVGAGKNTTPTVGSVASWPYKNHVGYVDRVQVVDGVTWVFITEDSISGWTKATWYSSADSSTYPVWFLHPYDVLLTADEAPVISGSAKVGETLRVQRGSWPVEPTSVTYEWFNGTTSLGIGDHYVVQDTDLWDDITVVETATVPGWATAPTRSDARTVTAHQFEGMAAATVAGVPHVGNVLSANLATTNSGYRLKWQWLRDGASIPNAIDESYTVTNDDLGKQLSVEITLTAVGYEDKTVRSGWTAAVEPAAVVLSGVTISGTAQYGATLTASATLGTQGANLAYQWYRNGFPISGAQGPTYPVGLSDIGTSITVAATASKTTYLTSTRISQPVVPVAAPISMSGVTISGTARVFSTLTANVSVSTVGTSVAYQWYRNGTTLVGTGSSYSPTMSDNGAVISVNVTVSKSGYATAYRYSSGVSVAPASMGTFYVTVQGTNRVEYTLSSAVTSATPGVSLTYNWKRNGSVVGTAANYTLQPADIGQSMTLTVTGTKSGYATSTSTYGIGTTAGYLSYSFSGSPSAISGVAKVGNTLTATSGLQTSGITMTYEWFRGTTKVGASKTYKLVAADKGAKMTVKITYDGTGYQKTTSTSPAVTVS